MNYYSHSSRFHISLGVAYGSAFMIANVSSSNSMRSIHDPYSLGGFNYDWEKKILKSKWLSYLKNKYQYPKLYSMFFFLH